MIFNLMKPVPTTESATMYLYGHEADKTVTYNGVELPELPVWDKTVYPYAIIGYSNVRENYVLEVSKEPNTAREDGYGVYVYTSEDLLFEVNEGEWASASAGGLLYSIIWANHDVYYTSTADTLFLAKSDPITTYTNADVTINGVGYVGEVLPKLPEWDKTAYPYAYIGHYSGIYYAYFTSVPLYYYNATVAYKYFRAKEEFQYLGISVENGSSAWSELPTTPNTSAEFIGQHVWRVWCNNDLLDYSDDSLVLSASNPVPVYE